MKYERKFSLINALTFDHPTVQILYTPTLKKIGVKIIVEYNMLPNRKQGLENHYAYDLMNVLKKNVSNNSFSRVVRDNQNAF